MGKRLIFVERGTLLELSYFSELKLTLRNHLHSRYISIWTEALFLNGYKTIPISFINVLEIFSAKYSTGCTSDGGCADVM